VNKPPNRPPAAPPELDPDAPPSEEEIAHSDALRRALEDPSLPNEAAELARAVSLANRPRPIEAKVHQAILEGALSGAKRVGPPGPAPHKQGGGTLTRVLFGVPTALAVAASVALIASSLGKQEAPVASVAAAPTTTPYRARSTQPLFDEPFEARQAKPSTPYRSSSGSARVDRIAMARAGDFRENEFSRWGAR
jgi:hypothetical protein